MMNATAANKPCVSIGMPVYNGENFVGEALDSILSQTFTDFELVISDNASTDATQEICQAYASHEKRIRYYRNQSNIGAAKNYNRVVELSAGQYFKWAAHDDVIAPTHLERCIASLERDPDIVLSFPRITYIDERGRVMSKQNNDQSLMNEDAVKRTHHFINFQRRSKDIFWSVFGLIRREALMQTNLIGSYNASDQVLLMELLLLGKFKQVPENLYFRREHPQASMTRYKSEKSRLAWFDPTVKTRVVWPHWNLFFKYLKCVRAAPLKTSSQLRCYYEVLRRFTYEAGTLAGEFKIVMRQLIGQEA